MVSLAKCSLMCGEVYSICFFLQVVIKMSGNAVMESPDYKKEKKNLSRTATNSFVSMLPSTFLSVSFQFLDLIFMTCILSFPPPFCHYLTLTRLNCKNIFRGMGMRQRWGELPLLCAEHFIQMIAFTPHGNTMSWNYYLCVNRWGNQGLEM